MLYPRPDQPRQVDRDATSSPIDPAPSDTPLTPHVVSCRQPTMTTPARREPIARQVESKNGQRNGEARNRGHPWRLEDRLPPEGHHAAPGHDAAADPKPEKAQRRLIEDHRSHQL